jgi:hypothetical protein
VLRSVVGASPRPALKERGPAPGPSLPLSGLFCLGQHDQRTGQFVGGESVREWT